MINTSSDSQESVALVPTFLSTVLEYSGRYAPAAAPARHIRPPSGPDSSWILVSYEDMQLPEQGWKLHLTANFASAEEVLQRALPVLLSEQVSFKVLASLPDLAHMNDGYAGLSQIGKFVTIYPRTDEEAVRLA